MKTQWARNRGRFGDKISFYVADGKVKGVNLWRDWHTEFMPTKCHSCFRDRMTSGQRHQEQKWIPWPRTEMVGPQTGRNHSEVKSSTTPGQSRFLTNATDHFHHGDRRPNGAKSGSFRFWYWRARLSGQYTRQTTRPRQGRTTLSSLDGWCLPCDIWRDMHDVGSRDCHSQVYGK